MAAAVGGAAARPILRILGTIVVIAVIAGGVFVYKKVANPDHLGQVIYSTDSQTSTSNCEITHQVTTVKVGTSVYAIYMFSHRLNSYQAVKEEDFKDGVSIGTYDLPTDKSADVDCLTVTDDLQTDFDAAGVYEIKLTSGTEVIADGKLTITP
jgi:hypothetical protein